VNDLGYKIKLTVPAKTFIAEKGYDAEYGARPLKRAIQKFIEDPLAEEIINSKINEGDTINIDFEEGADEVRLKVVKARKKKSVADDNNDVSDGQANEESQKSQENQNNQ
jgi:ATP-dependent Clp protease ATP-binding subunit ClpC